YQSQETSTDVELFARDPELMRQDFLARAAAERSDGENGPAHTDLWAGVQGPGVVPDAGVVPYPPPGAIMPVPPTTVLLQGSMFYGNATPTWQGSNGVATVQAVRLNDHGPCSHQVQLYPIFNQIAGTMWQQFACKVLPQGGTPELYYTTLC